MPSNKSPTNKRSKSPARPTRRSKSPDKRTLTGGSGALSQLTATETYGRPQNFDYQSYANSIPIPTGKGRKSQMTGGGNYALATEGSYGPRPEESTITIGSNSLLFAVGAIVILVIIGFLVYTRYTDELITQKMEAAAAIAQQSAQQAAELNTKANNKMQKLKNTRRVGKESLVDIEAHPELTNSGYRIVGPDADNPSLLSYWGYLTDKAYERVINPLLPPERSYENTYGIPLNIPSRDFPGGFQQIGYLYKDDIADPAVPVGQDSHSVIIPLFGQPVWPGANKWNYYITTERGNTVKMPFEYKGRMTDDEHGVDEIYDGDELTIKAYNGKFKTKIYKYDKPRYIPYVY
jgi:hypothetical protein